MIIVMIMKVIMKIEWKLNENNETEIIEAEEIDTGKIDWDW